MQRGLADQDQALGIRNVLERQRKLVEEDRHPFLERHAVLLTTRTVATSKR